MTLDCRGRPLDLSSPVVMGILNVTTDSFSDGGELLRAGVLDLDALLRRGEAMVAAGAAVLDVGAESTRPGAIPVPEALEGERVVTAVEALCRHFDVPVSVDTSAPGVMTAAVEAGAGLINDVRALRRPGALAAAAASGVPVCLMHMQGEPGTMQEDPHYGDVVREVVAFLEARISAAVGAGIARERLLVDPGFGFGKTLAHNLELLRQLAALRGLALPILVGLSRKRMLGELTGRPVEQRIASGVAAAVIAAERGASIVRTHDVAATVDALRILAAVQAY
ncbi:MAG: dihydropteroate synthase [Pseudomonadales bacterium]|jgi:dihydropteroate synthase|nr:dihydropteroate synthase [Pseudomonadales bacterium]